MPKYPGIPQDRCFAINAAAVIQARREAALRPTPPPSPALPAGTSPKAIPFLAVKSKPPAQLKQVLKVPPPSPAVPVETFPKSFPFTAGISVPPPPPPKQVLKRPAAEETRIGHQTTATQSRHQRRRNNKALRIAVLQDPDL